VTIWITGVAGFLGRHMAAALAGGSEPLVGLGLGVESGVPHLSFACEGLLENALLDRALALGGVPNLVYHFAGGSSVARSVAEPEQEWIQTVDSGVCLLDWLSRRAPETRLVMASSAAVYGSGHASPISEGARPDPYSPYGTCKKELEDRIREAGRTRGIQAVVLRLFSLYGPGLRRQVVWDIASRLADGAAVLDLGGTGEERRDFLHVMDAVTLLARVAPLATQEVPVFNGGSGRGRTVQEVAADVARVGGYCPEIRFSGVSRPGDPISLVADATRIAALGFRPAIPWNHGLATFWEWFRKVPR